MYKSLVLSMLTLLYIHHHLPELFPSFETKTLSVQFSSVAQSCPTLWDPMNRSTPGLPVHHQLLESTQTHVHRVGDAIQPSYPLILHPPFSCPQSFPALGSFPMSQLFASGGQSIGQVGIDKTTYT